MKTVIELLYLALICGGCFVLGYFIATVREHKRNMARLDRLKQDLSANNKERDVLRREMDKSSWEFLSKN